MSKIVVIIGYGSVGQRHAKLLKKKKRFQKFIFFLQKKKFHTVK